MVGTTVGTRFNWGEKGPSNQALCSVDDFVLSHRKRKEKYHLLPFLRFLSFFLSAYYVNFFSKGVTGRKFLGSQ